MLEPNSSGGGYAFELSAGRVARTLSIAVVLLTLFGIAGVFFRVWDYPQPASRWFANLFDLDRELNLPTWYQAFSILFSALLLAHIAHVKGRLDDAFRRHWRGLAFLFLLFFLDEALSLHELLIIPQVNEALGLPSLFHHTWVVAGLVFVACFVVLYFKFLLHLSSVFRRLFCLAGAVFVGGALAAEMLGGLVRNTYGRSSLETQLMAAGEEVLEMIGIVIWIYALLRYIANLKGPMEIRFRFLE